MDQQFSCPLETEFLSVVPNAYIYPSSGTTGFVPTPRPPTKFNFSPHFPEESIKRYPSLTCALGNNYPGPGNFSANDKPAMSSSILSYPIVPYPFLTFSNTDPIGNDFYPDISAAPATHCDLASMNFVPMLTPDRDAHRVEDISGSLNGFTDEGPSGSPSVSSVVVTADQSAEKKKQMSKHNCSLCGQFFRRFPQAKRIFPMARQSALKKHMKRHEEGFCSKPRPQHKCDICDKNFPR
ncbi:hypothetical protein B0H13DRAFT_1901700 [Mycena leptocephala]|nr:hypothetical protein B0H13DRAFT_1901700 [Mycena leptocephala]